MPEGGMKQHLRIQVTYADIDGRPVEGPAAHVAVDLDPVPTKKHETSSREGSE
jgi:hypothetical protein